MDPVTAPGTATREARRPHRGLRAGLVALVLVALAACGNDTTPSALDPRGPEARQLAFLWWVMLGLAGLVFVIVTGFAGVAMFRRHRSDAHPDEPRTRGDRLAQGDRRFIVWGGVVMPAVILTFLGVLTVGTTAEIAEREGDLVVEVEGFQFWWEVRYPDAGIVTANEVYIPADREVSLQLTSDDVIHSFWVPELAGKRDLVPGRTNTLVLEADEPGVYRGQCAEYCGLQHANMAIFVVALPPDEFDAWVEARAAGLAEPETELARRGRQVFETSACAGCHTVRGTAADGTLGPDLTDFASRRTIGAGAVPNDLGHLAGWVVDAQSIKPGALMPPVELGPRELDAVLAYLGTLE